MDTETFTRDLVRAGHRAFSLHLQPQSNTLGVDCLHYTAEDLTQLLGEIIELRLPLSLADPLLDHLAGSLGSNSPKILWRGFHNHHTAERRVFIDLLRILQQDLGTRVSHVLHHFFFSENGDFTSLWIDGCVDTLSI